MDDLSKLPPPPQGQTGVTLQSLKGLPPPPTGQKGMTLDEVKSTIAAPVQPKKTVLGSIGNAAKSVGNFLTSSEQALGKDLTAGIQANAQSKAEDTLRNSQSSAEKTLQDHINALNASGQDSTHAQNALGMLRTNSIAPQAGDFQKAVPESTKSNTQGLLDVAGTAADALSAGTFGAAAKGLETGKLASKAIPTVVKAGEEGIKKIGGAISSGLAKKATKDTLDIVTPKLTKNETEKALASGKGVSGGLLSKGKIVADKLTQDTADAVHGLVKKSNGAIKNINNVREALTKEAKTLKKNISSVDHPYTFKELSSALNKVEKPISIKGTAFEKQIDAVKSAALDLAKKSGGKVSDLLDARKSFDNLVEKEYPNLYDRENAPMRNAITGIRNSINDFIEKNLPNDVSFKNSLKKQSLFYNAIDNIAGKSAGEVGTSKLGRLVGSIKKNPVAYTTGAYLADKAVKGITGGRIGF